jgi:two-component system chemotaxis response regulator CheY
MHGTKETTDMEAVTLPAVVDLAAAEALLVTLQEAQAAGRRCRLDAAQVETLMLPGIQVILAAVRGNARVEVVNPSASFCSAFEDAALSWSGEGAGEPGAVAPGAAALAIAECVGAEPVLEAAVQPADDAVIESAPAMQAEVPPAPAGPKRILTIDDSKTMRDMLRFTLVDAGYDVLQAVDGQDGLDVLSKERVDIVITDINMPKLDGYGVIRHMRADSCYDDTPILVLSTESDQKTKDIGREAGATGWLVKPFDPDQLVEIVRQVSP